MQTRERPESARLRQRASSRHELEQLADDSLVARCAAGEEAAWRVLVRRYRRLVYAVPNRAGLHQDQVEEIFHETFARLAGQIRDLRDPTRVRAWIVTTARRLTIDRIRARGQSREIDTSDTQMNQIADEAELPLESLERIEQQHLVRVALQRLASRCRRLLILLFYHRTDQPPAYEEVAEELGMPVGSIGPTRARCLQRLLTEYEALQAEE